MIDYSFLNLIFLFLKYESGSPNRRAVLFFLCADVGCRVNRNYFCKALESMGFIQRVKRLGTIVNDFHNISRQAPLSTSLILSDLDELLEFRVMIEAELARLAAKRARPENLTVMAESLEKMRSCGGNIQELTNYDTMFHMEIAKASGNHLLINTMENARDAFNSGIYRAFQVDTQANVAEALLFHDRILDAITRQESEEAYALMRQHIRAVGSRMNTHRTEQQ